MTSLELYKFVDDNQIEYHWHDEDVIAFVTVWDIEDFNKMLGVSILDEEGIKCTMKEKYFCFWMKDICEYFDIKLDEIFPNKSN
jgi:hypothetical protein